MSNIVAHISEQYKQLIDTNRFMPESLDVFSLSRTLNISKAQSSLILNNLQSSGYLYVKDGIYYLYETYTTHSLNEVAQARYMLESESILSTIKTITPSDIHHLENALHKKLNGCCGNSCVQLDYEFHLALVECSKNQVLIHMYTMIKDTILSYINAHLLSKEQYIDELLHIKLIEEIKAHNIDSALHTLKLIL